MPPARPAEPQSLDQLRHGISRDVRSDSGAPPLLADEPGYRYGTVLPYRQKVDAQGQDVGDKELAWPEVARVPVGVVQSMVRGAGEIGSKVNAPSRLEAGDIGLPGANGLSPDAMSALGLGALPLEGAGSTVAGTAKRALTESRGPKPSPEAAAAALNLDTRRASGALAAERKVTEWANQDVLASGKTAEDAAKAYAAKRGLGLPMMPLDIGENTAAQAGSVSRQPGPSLGIIPRALEERDAGSMGRLNSAVGRDLFDGQSAYRTAQNLVETKQAEAQPLYDKAFQGGSVAPLKDQFERAFTEASGEVQKAEQNLASANANLTAVRSRAIPTDNVYATSASNDATRQAEAAVRQATAARDQAVGAKDQVLERLRQAQSDIENNTPGAVWNPHIQRLLDRPIMKRGMARGVEIQGNEAAARNIHFDPTELALTPNGEVIRVPNMRTLDAGKKGLDAIIESEGRNDYGGLNQWGRSVDEVRRALLDQMDAINGDYKTARQSWAGHSASLDAVKVGQNLAANDSKMPLAEAQEIIAGMTEGEREFARIGAADKLLEGIRKTRGKGDEAKRVLSNEDVKMKLRPLFKTEEDFNRMVASVEGERDMFDRKGKVIGNSLTAARQAVDASNGLAAVGHTAHGMWRAVQGHLSGALHSAQSAYSALGLGSDQELNAQIAKLLTDQEITPVAEGGKLVISRPIMAPRPATLPGPGSQP